MMGVLTKVSGAALFALTVSVAAQPAVAQESSLERAERLESRAQTLLGDMEEWKDAAELYRQAAQLRPEGDPQAVEDLLQAARLGYYVGSERAALRDLETAGVRALNEGDVLTAARAFADAAWIASDEGEQAKALEFATRAQRLTFSPLIGEAERDELRERFTGFEVGG